jgi:uncharacterized membrane protein (UPF0182 family)
MPIHELPAPRRRFGLPILLIAAFALLVGSRTIASYVVEYAWWREIGQVPTWLDLLLYSLAPVAAATVLSFIVLFLAHARALKFAGTGLGEHPLYAKLSTVVVLLVSVALSAASIETWTVVRYFGGLHLPQQATAWHDSVFNLPLSFYLFDLPFYSVLRGYVLALLIAAAILYWAAARGWQMKGRMFDWQDRGQIDPRIFRLEGGLESKFLRIIAGFFLLAMALRFFLGRYEMLWNDHGFMTGVDYVNLNISLPLQWLVIAACVLAAIFVWMGRWKAAAWMGVALVIRFVAPPVVSAAYVKPNEISLERPFIKTHIEATRSAFDLSRRSSVTEFKADIRATVDPSKHAATLDNVRLWDWRAFHDTVTQYQALRPYYVFHDTDVDRYMIDGRLRQILLSPRELDIRQLPDAQTRWINPHFIYTHGYGIVMAETNKIQPSGLPVFFIHDMPPAVETKSLKVTRPELYYSEVTHEPVFVRTAQPEFNYPSGADNVFSRYEGKGGFPISSLPMRIAAALSESDYNILLTSYLTPESRMMIRRDVRGRLESLAGFVKWETDPYLVLSEDGRLVWIVDGYTTSDAHPYSRAYDIEGIGSVNYIRNSVKATVDAYDGTMRLYVFDPADPIIQAYQQLFPRLFEPASAMPADLRAHTRYPETFFRVQAEVYRMFHMQDPQAFYNKEDVWDIARNTSGQGTEPAVVAPTYVVATLPNETAAEFLLILPFTPRTKDNMIGLMVARCDGEHLGELRYLLLSKQELTLGPMQVEALIDQDQNISKDLTLWNQQGSRVLRGNMIVLPVGNNFIYVEPIYIQASEARMPQLKKIALVAGNTLIYTDTWEEAVAQLAGRAPAPTLAATPGAAAAGAPPPAVTPKIGAEAEQRLQSVRNHLRRYQELAAQGKWAEAGKELEAAEAEVKR